MMKGDCVRDEVLDLTIVVPSYNPDEKLSKVVGRLLERGFHDIIVVNDGSDDEHMNPFSAVEGKATIIHCRKNRGRGRAIKLAFAFCSEHRKRSHGVIIVDLTYQYHPDDVYACGKALLENDGHLIIGCRNFQEERMSFVSKLGNGIKNGAFRLFGGIKVSDTGAGLRAIGMSKLPEIMEIKGEHQEYERNMLLETKKLSLPITEVTVRTLSA